MSLYNFHKAETRLTYPFVKCNDFFCRWYVLSRCNLHLWPLDLELLRHLGCRVFNSLQN